MIYKNVINLINRLNIHHEIYADRKDQLKWGTEYYSYQNTNNEIIYYFPYSPLRIHKILFRPGIDMCPVEWTLSISNDNKTFVTIIEDGAPICRESDIQDFQKHSFNCKAQDPLSFDAIFHNEFSYFIKFKLIQNSYYETQSSVYKQLINTKGIDFVAELLTEFKVTFPHLPLIGKQCFITCFILLTLIK